MVSHMRDGSALTCRLTQLTGTVSFSLLAPSGQTKASDWWGWWRCTALCVCWCQTSGNLCDTDRAARRRVPVSSVVSGLSVCSCPPFPWQFPVCLSVCLSHCSWKCPSLDYIWTCNLLKTSGLKCKFLCIFKLKCGGAETLDASYSSDLSVALSDITWTVCALQPCMDPGMLAPCVHVCKHGSVCIWGHAPSAESEIRGEFSVCAWVTRSKQLR